MGKIVLFYKYINIESPKAIKEWLVSLCSGLGLRGRIILAHEGINGTLGGSNEAINKYKEVMNAHPLFSDIDWKESEGSATNFPRLQIKVKKEIVYLGLDPQEVAAQNGGTHLTPEQTHALLSQQPKDLIIFDARNRSESKIGHFTHAITPEISHFRQLPQFIDEHIELFKDKKVLMYCTGGIRCERASAYLKSKGLSKEVFQIKGGIHRYIEKYPDGYFRGKNYVFDGRIAVKVTDDILSVCELCNAPCDTYNNCINASCNKHFICCDNCTTNYENCCSETCYTLVKEGQVHKRPVRQKIYQSCSAETNAHTNE